MGVNNCRYGSSEGNRARNGHASHSNSISAVKVATKVTASFLKKNCGRLRSPGRCVTFTTQGGTQNKALDSSQRRAKEEWQRTPHLGLLSVEGLLPGAPAQTGHLEDGESTGGGSGIGVRSQSRLEILVPPLGALSEIPKVGQVPRVECPGGEAELPD